MCLESRYRCVSWMNRGQIRWVSSCYIAAVILFVLGCANFFGVIATDKDPQMRKLIILISCLTLAVALVLALVATCVARLSDIARASEPHLRQNVLCQYLREETSLPDANSLICVCYDT